MTLKQQLYEQVFSLWKQGKSPSEISQITGLSRPTIYKLIEERKNA